ncbi:unnamed protein product [Dovyalis caffra]|uniref:Uncharacterized protein n=1 Tax=Dovyalis caffra TaxID=77055 RepID=A0AAV1RDR2_9ROSI|nr:unnamed protein product [Dovyalis caffra]
MESELRGGQSGEGKTRKKWLSEEELKNGPNTRDQLVTEDTLKDRSHNFRSSW